MDKRNHRNLTALVTGASEGIGLELAKVMAADGWNLAITARREELLNQIAGELGTQYKIDCHVIPADLAYSNAVGEICDGLKNRGLTIDALINNAGFGYYGLFSEQDAGKLQSMIDVNISALMNLTNSLLPGMIERRKGWVMNVASTAAFQPVPINAVYAATKAFVLSFSEALATELSGSGVTVTCLCPGVTRTGFARVAGAKHLDTDFRGAMSAEAVAGKGYKAMMKGRRTVVTGTMNAFLAFVTRFIPRSLAAKAALKIMKSRRH